MHTANDVQPPRTNSLDRSTYERCRPARLKMPHEQKWFAANQPTNTKEVGVDEEVVEVAADVVDPVVPALAQCSMHTNKQQDNYIRTSN